MTEKQETLPTDPTLTTQNAGKRGYHWVMDVARNDEGEIEIIDEILRMVEEEGYKVGQPKTPGFPSVPYGVYKPLKKPVQPQKKV